MGNVKNVKTEKATLTPSSTMINWPRSKTLKRRRFREERGGFVMRVT